MKAIALVCLFIVLFFAVFGVVRGSQNDFNLRSWLENLSTLQPIPKPPQLTFTSYNFTLESDFPVVNSANWYDSNAGDYQNFLNFFRYGIGSFFTDIGSWLAYLPTFLGSFFDNFKVVGFALRDLVYIVKYPFDIVGWFFRQLGIITQGAF